MAYPIGSIHTKKGEHRLHESFFMVGLASTSLMLAFLLRFTQNVKFDPSLRFGLHCKQMDRNICFPDLFIHMLVQTIPDKMEIRIEETGEEPREERSTGKKEPSPRSQLFIQIVLPYFVKFYEDFRPWLEKQLGNNHTKFPATWRFGRIIRNAAAHGSVRIDDPKFEPVSWYGLTYGPSQSGRKIFESDLTEGDLLILMLEMNEALDQIGAPYEP